MPLFPPKTQVTETKLTAQEAAAIYELMKTKDATQMFIEDSIDFAKSEMVLNEFNAISGAISIACSDESITTKTKLKSAVAASGEYTLDSGVVVDDYMAYTVGKDNPTFSEFKQAFAPSV